MTTLTFAGMPGVSRRIAAALAEREIVEPFPIQQQVIPLAVDGGDVLAQAPTGSGKTLAFGIPLVMRLASAAASDRRARTSTIRGLVLVPTRELAVQVIDEITPVAQAHHVQLAAVFGGAGLAAQERACRRAQLVVATPGRLQDLIDRGSVRLTDVSCFVLDEADRMLDMGFAPQVERIAKSLPRRRQTMLFSATLEGAVNTLVERHTSDPHRVRIAHDVENTPDIEHIFEPTTQAGRTETLVRLLQQPRDQTVVFVRTKRGADRLVRKLKAHKVRSTAIHGGMTQPRRLRELAAFRDGDFDTIVATDVFARGIDIDSVSHVINYDPPEDDDTYLHRAGRTGRAGRVGCAITLVTPDQLNGLLATASRIGLTDAGQSGDPESVHTHTGRGPGLQGDTIMPNGTVKFFNGDKGYGFITPEDGSKDVFVHFSNVSDSVNLDEGMKVVYEIGEGRKGPEARNVRLA